MALSDLISRTIAFLRGRKTAYQLTFGSPAGQQVMIDLARFCRANETCFSPDARIHAVAEGRREVWLRIQQHLNLSPNALFELYNAGVAQQIQGD